MQGLLRVERCECANVCLTHQVHPMVQHQVVEQYKRQIFDHRGGSGGQSLKEELMKLSRRVTERIPNNLGQDMTCDARAPIFRYVLRASRCLNQVRRDASADRVRVRRHDRSVGRESLKFGCRALHDKREQS